MWVGFLRITCARWMGEVGRFAIGVWIIAILDGDGDDVR